MQLKMDRAEMERERVKAQKGTMEEIKKMAAEKEELQHKIKDMEE